MAKADRLERLDAQRRDLEREYRDTLKAALMRTAEGSWGLFDHRQNRAERAAVAPVITLLEELGDTIESMREQLFMEPFALHHEFIAARGPVKPSAVGEPKQAKAWLERFDESED